MDAGASSSSARGPRARPRKARPAKADGKVKSGRRKAGKDRSAEYAAAKQKRLDKIQKDAEAISENTILQKNARRSYPQTLLRLSEGGCPAALVGRSLHTYPNTSV